MTQPSAFYGFSNFQSIRNREDQLRPACWSWEVLHSLTTDFQQSPIWKPLRFLHLTFSAAKQSWGAPLTPSNPQEHAGLNTPRSGGANYTSRCGAEFPATEREGPLSIKHTQPTPAFLLQNPLCGECLPWVFELGCWTENKLGGF